MNSWAAAAARRRQVAHPAEPPDPLHQWVQSAVDKSCAIPERTSPLCQPVLDRRRSWSCGWPRSCGNRRLRNEWQLCECWRKGHAALAAPLAELRMWPAAHRETTLALARLVSPAELAYLARTEPDSPLRQTLMTALLERGNDQAVQPFLQLVRHPSTCDIALRSAADAGAHQSSCCWPICSSLACSCVWRRPASWAG